MTILSCVSISTKNECAGMALSMKFGFNVVIASKKLPPLPIDERRQSNRNSHNLTSTQAGDNWNLSRDNHGPRRCLSNRRRNCRPKHVNPAEIDPKRYYSVRRFGINKLTFCQLPELVGLLPEVGINIVSAWHQIVEGNGFG